MKIINKYSTENVVQNISNLIVHKNGFNGPLKEYHKEWNKFSSKGGTYNPRQAWQTIDKGRKVVPRNKEKNISHKPKDGNSYYTIFIAYL